MQTVKKFLQDCGTFYLATIEGDQPRVRPFGAVSTYEGKLYICTNSTKPVSHQMKQNPKVEISGCLNGDWLRLTAEAVLDERREAKVQLLEENPALKDMYSPDDGIFEVYYLKDAKAAILSFTGRNDTYAF